MCVNEIFSEQRPDGRIRTWSEPDLCPRSRHGELCDKTKELRRPAGYQRRTPTYSYGQLPPTPPLSYHSDYTSDSERSSRRRSGVYASDHKVIDINRRRSLRHERHGSGEHNLYVDNSPLSRSPLSRSPLSRTPPLYRHRSVSSSPARDIYIEPSSSYRDTSDRERPTSIKVEIINERPKHRKQGSSSKTGSSHGSNEEGHRHRRLSSVHHGDQHRQRTKESEIARQNEAIANRTPVPSISSMSPRYRRGSVSIEPTTTMTERIRLDEEKRQLRRLEKKEREREREIEREREAEKRRLKNRFSLKGPQY